MEAPKWVHGRVQRLFRIESILRHRKQSRGLDDVRYHVLRFEVRRRITRRLLGQIDRLVEELLQDPSVLPKSELGKAIGYIRKQWETLNGFIADGALEASPNAVEGVIRSVVLGRKNWMFVASPKGGAVAARLYSLVLMCKALGINPEAYLADVLVRVAKTPASKIATLTPGAWAKGLDQVISVDETDPDPFAR